MNQILQEVKLFEFGADGGGASVYKLPDDSIAERGSSGGILDEEEDPVKKWERLSPSWEAWWSNFKNTHKENWIHFSPLFIHDDIKSFIQNEVDNYKPNNKETRNSIENWRFKLAKQY